MNFDTLIRFIRLVHNNLDILGAAALGYLVLGFGVGYVLHQQHTFGGFGGGFAVATVVYASGITLLWLLKTR
ncbi:hypothetical protein LLS1_01570 [Leifsonia sp. LS1]|uniref:hypothetical protein n=1 Tax=Leifsonia sp. LS1 TaxID=2828483 RepID=UPI001CFCCF5C|nr:hypothetical protein [Leifsonia sp. LS1]GIT78488.1 hypothetical protein LLS1_01570 [Leifsonia sp. LS1]